MKLKTLLLGSAAAMIAVSGARAADAVVVEAEPMEYVKVCDMYGAGFFYIPGTETCLRINGEARATYQLQERGLGRVGMLSNVAPYLIGGFTYNSAAGAAAAAPAGVNNGSFTHRARVGFDTRNETDLGTLASFIRLEGSSAGVRIDTATVSLNGLTFGFGDTFFTTNTSYGHPGNMLDGFYSFTESTYAQYTYAANGFSATAGVQLGTAATVGGTDASELDVYVGGSYSGSWGRVSASYIHDNDVDDGAWSVGAELTPIENLRIDAWYQADGGQTQYVSGFGGGTGNARLRTGTPAAGGAVPFPGLQDSDEQWGIGASYQVTNTIGIGAGYSVLDGANIPVALVPLAAGGGSTQPWEGEKYVIGFSWTPVSNLLVQVDYEHFESEGVNAAAAAALAAGGFSSDFDEDTFRIRVTRSW